MTPSLKQRNVLIAFLLLGLIGVFGYATYSYLKQSVEKIESTYQEEQSFVKEKDTRNLMKDFLNTYSQEETSGSQKILPLTKQNSTLFTHIGSLGEHYDILTNNFRISTPDTDQPFSSPHTEMTSITFDFIGSRYHVKEFVSRLEEVTPLITIRDFTLVLDESQATRGSLTLETYRFDYQESDTKSMNDSYNLLPQTPDVLPSYPYLFDLTDQPQLQASPSETEDAN